MRNHIKIFLLSTLCALAAALGFPAVAHGAFIITEVMYDVPGTDTGREWVEVQNAGAEAVDLSQWKLFEANVAHKISAVGQAVVPAGGFAVIVDVPEKFAADNPGFAGLVFDSAFSLSGSGESLSLKDGSGAEFDPITYDPSIGAAGDGLSLQRAAAGWIAVAPTPGGATVATESAQPQETAKEEHRGGETDSTGQSVDQSAHASQSVANTSVDAADLSVTSGRSRLGFVGVPLSFEAKLKSSKTAKSARELESLWSMGDGSIRAGDRVWHSYQYPGEYVVVLNSTFSSESAVSRSKVKVVEPVVSIGAASAEFVEIKNEGDHELNLGGWIAETRGAKFAISDDTLVPARSSLKLPSTVTHLGELREYVRLSVPSGKVMASARVGQPGITIILPEGMDAESFAKSVRRNLETR